MIKLTKTQELELLSSLESRAESPVKFAYIGDGCERWAKIAEMSRSDYNLEFEEDLLKKESLPFIFRKAEKGDMVNIIDFGCGDGVTILPIIEYLESHSIEDINYIPVDISQDMLDKAIKTIKDRFPSITATSILFDFEKGEIIEKILQFSRDKNTHNYFFLLGNTIGNFDNTEKVLSNLKMSMFSSDHLIIGNQISNLLNTGKIIEYYNSKIIFDFGVGNLKNYGFDCSFEEYKVRWNEKKKQIEAFLALKKNKEITINDRTLKFEKNEEILLFISKKYVEETIVEMLNRSGFRIDLFTTNARKDNCIISVSPTRYRS